MKSVLVAIFACFAVPVAAQSSLGISGAQVSLGVVEDESGHSRTEFGALVDVAITGVHGFQGDLRFDDTQAGGVGTLAAHLYMTPREGQKYGLFATLADVAKDVSDGLVEVVERLQCLIANRRRIRHARVPLDLVPKK